MARRLELPLLLAGPTGPLGRWLAEAGVPAESVTAPDIPRDARFRFVLYDGGSRRGRRAGESARQHGLEAIDISPLIPTEKATVTGLLAGKRRSWGSGSRGMWALKRLLETAGGTWMRIADCPYPWQRMRPADPPVPPLAKGGPGGVAAGPRDEMHSDAEAAAVDQTADERLLTWEPEPALLERWQNFRRQLSFRLERSGSLFKISTTGDLAGFRPMVELWRGPHVASFELVAGTTVIPSDNLVFQRRPAKHPADPSTVHPRTPTHRGAA